MRKRASWAARLTLLLVATLLSLEVLLQLVSLFVSDRSTDHLLDRRQVVICLGDSNTYGMLVPATETYPAHLQKILDARAPDRFSVINLGIPGTNSSQIRSRLANNLTRFRPAVVVLWVGTNDVWNHMELGRVGGVGHASRWEQVEGVLLRSRVYRFIRNLQKDLELHAGLKDSEARGVREEIEIESWDRGDGGTIIVRQGGREERVTATTDPRKRKKNDHISERIYLELMHIGDYIRQAGVELVLLRYPLDFQTFRVANIAVQSYADDFGVPLVDTTASLSRVPEKDVEWLYGDHPNPPVYREIAMDVANVVLRVTGPDGK